MSSELERRVGRLEARVEWLRGIALDRAGVAEDVKLVRERLTRSGTLTATTLEKVYGPEVLAAFERLVTRLTEGGGE